MSPGKDLSFACTCGTLRGRLTSVTPRSGALIVCHCADCRAAELALGQPDPAPQGVALYQTTPDKVTLDSGSDQLALLRLSDKGLFRWHAACCSAPLFNTTPKPGFAFASLHAGRAADVAALGPLVGEVNGPKGNKGLFGMIIGVLRRSAAARLSGRWRQNPFFDADSGAPVVTPRVLTAKERAALTDS